jgi:hypothetical protein
MMLTGEAVAAIGFPQRNDLDAVVVRFVDGKAAHYRLAECAEYEVKGEIYLATGLFLPGTIDRSGGRREENVAQIVSLPFDFDLADWMGCDREALWDYPQPVIDDLIAAQQENVEELFTSIGLPIHRLDYTGYGLAAHVFLPPHDKAAVPQLRALHKAIVSRINKVARQQLADPQVSDAGTRIMRLPGSTNLKGAEPRLSRTIYLHEGVVDEAQLRLAAGETRTQSTPPERLVPKSGQAFDAVTEASIVSAIAPHWKLGQKHILALALAGMFAKAGVPEEQTLRMIETLSASDDKPWDRIKAVRTSYEKVRSGLQVKGFFALRDLVPGDLISWLDGHLAQVRAATAPILLMGAERVTPPVMTKHVAISEPPASAFFGWIGDYRDLMEPTTEAPDAFHLGTALTLIGAMIGRRVHVRYAGDALFPNLYTVLIGASGSSRKDTAIKRGLAVPQLQKSSMTFVKPAFNVSRDVSSAEGLVSILKEQPNTLLYLTELSALMENARRKATRTILDKLIEAWDTPHKLENLNKNSPQTADNPCLSIIAATQPGRLAAQMSDEDIHSGFANRWLYLVGEGKDARPRPPAVDEVAAWRMYLDLKHAIESYGDGKALVILPEVGQVWDDWYVSQHGERDVSEEEAAMRVRHATLIQKIALIYAVTEGAEAIGLRHIEPAMELVSWMWTQVKEMLKTWGVQTDTQVLQRIHQVLAKKGEMKRWQLQAACSNRRWTSADFTRALDNAIKNGTVVMPLPGIVALNGDM